MTTETNYASTVNSLYLAFYGRPADPAGLKFWSEQLANANGDTSAIVADFANSEEAQTRFGSDTTADRVTEIYQQLFNRAPDAEGLAYWTNVVEKGNASIADVSIAILNGAKGTDNDLVSLRQQAMDKFTAQVEAEGSDYSGYAAVEAARVLVRAVTLNATGTDVDTLVKSAVSFAATATKTPAVVDAIATGTTLNALFDTTRGTADPVALAQTLADTAKAAAGNPVTLDSLLRGGGMAQVLKVMPANATLGDVVKALASGGLPAAVEVVYPTAPVKQPAAPLNLSFSSVSEGVRDLTHDNVTNKVKADVNFHYTGKDLTSTQHFEYSLDGRTWTREGVTLSVSDKLVTVQGIDLSEGTVAGGLHPKGVDLSNSMPTSSGTLATPDLQTTVYLRAVNDNGTVIKSVSQAIVYDSYAAPVSIVLDKNPYGNNIGLNYGDITNNATFKVEGKEMGATLEYLRTGDFAGEPEVVRWTKGVPELKEGMNSFSLHQVDAAGNVSDERQYYIVLDTDKPKAPTIVVQPQDNSSSSGSTNGKPVILISDLEKSGTTVSA